MSNKKANECGLTSMIFRVGHHNEQPLQGRCLSTDSHPGPCISWQLFLGVSVAVPLTCAQERVSLPAPLPPSQGPLAAGLQKLFLQELWFYHGCHPGRGRLSWFCVLSPGPEAALLPALSLTQPFTVYSGLLTKSSLRGLKTHPQAWLRVSPSSIPLWDFPISPFFPLSTNTLLLFPSSQANSSSANQLLLIDTCRGHQPPRSTVSRGWYELSREEPWAQGLESEVKHYIFPNHSVIRENSRELLGLRVGVSAIEWVLAI